MLDTLPEHIRDAAKAILQPGEVVRWAEAREIPRMRIPYTIALVVTMVGLALVLWLPDALPRHSKDATFVAVFGIFLTGTGVLSFKNAASALKRAQNSAWLVTDRRVIDLEARAIDGPNAISYEPNVIAPREKRVAANASGNLAFFCVVRKTDNGPRLDHIGMDVRDLAGAEAAMELLLPGGGNGTKSVLVSENAALSPAAWEATVPALRAAIDAELRAGEQVYWFSQPIPDIMFDNVLSAAVVILFAGMPLSIFFLKDSATLGFVISVASSIALMGYANAWSVSDFADKAYIITNQRAIEVTATYGGSRTIVSVFPHEFDMRKKSTRFDGVGCLFFLHETARSKKGKTVTRTVGFKRIHDVAGAEKALDRLAGSAANAASVRPHPVARWSE